MESEMAVEALLDYLEEHREVSESYVLLREIKAYLEVDHPDFYPCIRIKIYRTRLNGQDWFHFELSHNVHTPEQAGPYYPSRTTEELETIAVDRAINATTTFIKAAIRAGHRPSDRWLVPNERF
ncbi:hypothetical protein CMZ84_07080 [Lysobacteraceae bacterium NML93-0399]|nr:hypothetical protein CMZ84_07080 [Xanthomonadaceae bacterium NML93-0399]